MPGKLWTGFYIDRGQIFGPERSGHFYIRDRRIYGPLCAPGQLAPNLWSFDEPPPPLTIPGAGPAIHGDYYLDRGRIFGPRANGNFYIKRNHIYGPPGLKLPWLQDESESSAPPPARSGAQTATHAAP
jgi:hypothetical protein